MHLWVQDDGRPAAIGTIFGWTIGDNRRMLHQEFHSLADMPIVASHEEEEFRTSKLPGVNWQPVPKGPQPPNSRVRRRLQSKQLAGKFTSYMVDQNQRRWELRRVQTPIYEYEVRDQPDLGGALFAFCRGTDVETYSCSKSEKSMAPRGGNLPVPSSPISSRI